MKLFFMPYGYVNLTDKCGSIGLRSINIVSLVDTWEIIKKRPKLNCVVPTVNLDKENSDYSIPKFVLYKTQLEQVFSYMDEIRND